MFNGKETAVYPDRARAEQLRPRDPEHVTPGSKSAPPLVIASLDWFSATLRDVPDAVHHSELLEWASEALGVDKSDWVEADHGMYGFNEMLLGPGGSKYLFSGWLDHAHIILPGQACQQAGPERLIKLMGKMLDWGAIKRVDIAADDHDRTMTPADVRKAMARGECVSRARNWQGIESGKIPHAPEEGDQLPLGGDTFYVGKFSGKRLLRIYDKAVESGGENNAIRWELQTRDDAAVNLARDVTAGGPSNLGLAWASHVRAYCDWRERDVVETEERRITVWWERLVQGAQAARSFVARPARTIEQVKSWLSRQVAPSLAAVVKHADGDMAFVHGLLDQGRVRMRPEHLAMAGGMA